jgi:hypothetical protein
LTSTRDVVWEGLLNARDLGGHPTEDGGVTRYGAVVRADSVRKLTEAGWQSLTEHGIRTVVDLRFHDELAADPPHPVPVDVVHVSVFPEPDDPLWLELDRHADVPVVAEMTAAVYLDLLDRRRAHFAEAVEAVAAAGPGGVVVHCTAGKDRTGLVAAFLLRLVGVPVEHVAADYGASSINLRAHGSARIVSPDHASAGWRIFALAPADAMANVLDAVEREHGSVGGFLRSGGASQRTLDAVRGRLRD